MYIHNTGGTPLQSKHTQSGELTQVTPCKVCSHLFNHMCMHTSRQNTRTNIQTGTRVHMSSLMIHWHMRTSCPAPPPLTRSAASAVPTHISPHTPCAVLARPPVGAGLAVVEFAIIHILYTQSCTYVPYQAPQSQCNNNY